MATVVIASVFFGMLAARLVSWALFLRIGLRWAKVQDVTRRRVVLATLVVFIWETVLPIGALFEPTSVVLHVILAMGLILAALLVPWFVIMHLFQASFFRAVQAWLLPTFLTPVVIIAMSFLVVRPFFVKPFYIPTNAMAPTLLGEHQQGTCAECGGTAFGSPVRDQFDKPFPFMICRDYFHVTEPISSTDQVFTGDRILAAKFLRPQRWDVVVFYYPEDPSELFAMRLVGMPGEEITIKEGQIWADGQRLTPPDSIGGITYSSHVMGWPDNLWGAPENPALLGDDEYFVLGDFSINANDSRIWLSGSPGHNPFAVPQSHLHGVVTHVPPRRWRAFR